MLIAAQCAIPWQATVTSGQARFTVLTPQLIRIEWATAAGDAFEDRPSLAFVRRNTPVPKFSHSVADGVLTIATANLTLTYATGQPFAAATLAIKGNEGTPGGGMIDWRHGMTSAADPGNLLGTFRTLDQTEAASLNCTANGGEKAHPHCEFGLVSRSGWALVDDTGVPVLDDVADWWTDASGAMLRNADAEDLYFFGHGHAYTQALKDYSVVGGSIPVFPRYSSGVWWTRCPSQFCGTPDYIESALRCTASAWMLIVAQCSAIPRRQGTTSRRRTASASWTTTIRAGSRWTSSSGTWTGTSKTTGRATRGTRACSRSRPTRSPTCTRAGCARAPTSTTRPSKFRGTPDCNAALSLHSYGLDAHCYSVLRNPTTGRA